MSSIILFKQLLVLLALMITGIISYKTDLIDDNTHNHLSSLMVWILNPFLMISGVIGKNSDINGTLIVQNIIMVILMYSALFLIGFVYIFILRYKGRISYLYRFITLFPNVGFMGVPLVKEMFGNEYVVLVAFYILAFNLICYSYGVYLASNLGDKTEKFDFKKLISPGTIASLLSIIIFALHLNLPSPIVSFAEYLGNTSIAMSMIIIGVSLAKTDIKKVFINKDYFIYAIAKMLIIPILMILAVRVIPFDTHVIGVFQIMICMPIASMTCMFSKEYGSDEYGDECAKLIAFTTLLTVVSAPLVILIAG